MDSGSHLWWSEIALRRQGQRFDSAAYTAFRDQGADESQLRGTVWTGCDHRALPGLRCCSRTSEPDSLWAASGTLQIGRASCRERVEFCVVDVGLNSKR